MKLSEEEDYTGDAESDDWYNDESDQGYKLWEKAKALQKKTLGGFNLLKIGLESIQSLKRMCKAKQTRKSNYS